MSLSKKETVTYNQQSEDGEAIRKTSVRSSSVFHQLEKLF